MIKYILALLALFYTLPAFSEVTLYYSPNCPHSQKVLTYLKESKTSINLKNVLKDPGAKQELQEYGGYLIVPCLVIDGRAIYDAPDIIDWLSSHKSPS
jgi:glutaredoxin